MTLILSDYLRLILESHRRTHKLKISMDKYIRSRFNEDTNFLDDPSDQRTVRHLNDEIAKHLPSTPVRQRSLEENQLPGPFLEAYDLLYTSAFGSGAMIIGDPNKLHDSGKPLRARTSTGQTQQRGGAVEKRRLSSQEKNIIRNERAFNLKRAIDRKLRSIGRDIYQELDAKHAPEAPNHRCGQKVSASPVKGCGRYVESNYAYCPYCGRKQA